MLKWYNYEIVAPHDRANLERASHILEQFHGMPRAMAESMAYDKYKAQQHAKAAGHHLMGMVTSKENLRDEDAKKHYMMYILHMQALGLNYSGAVPPEITAHKPIDWPFDCYVEAEGDVLLKNR